MATLACSSHSEPLPCRLRVAITGQRWDAARKGPEITIGDDGVTVRMFTARQFVVAQKGAYSLLLCETSASTPMLLCRLH